MELHLNQQCKYSSYFRRCRGRQSRQQRLQYQIYRYQFPSFQEHLRICPFFRFRYQLLSCIFSFRCLKLVRIWSMLLRIEGFPIQVPCFTIKIHSGFIVKSLVNHIYISEVELEQEAKLVWDITFTF